MFGDSLVTKHSGHCRRHGASQGVGAWGRHEGYIRHSVVCWRRTPVGDPSTPPNPDAARPLGSEAPGCNWSARGGCRRRSVWSAIRVVSRPVQQRGRQGQNCRYNAQSWPITAKLDEVPSTFVQIRLPQAHPIGANSADSGPRLVDVGQRWLKFGRIRPKVGQFRRRIGRLQAKLAECGVYIWSKCAPMWPNLGRCWSITA